MADDKPGDLQTVLAKIKEVESQVHMLAQRASKLEEFQREVKPHTSFLVASKAIAGLMAITILITAGIGLYRFGALDTEMKHLNKSVDDNQDATNRLTQLILERLPKTTGERAAPAAASELTPPAVAPILETRPTSGKVEAEPTH